MHLKLASNKYLKWNSIRLRLLFYTILAAIIISCNKNDEKSDLQSSRYVFDTNDLKAIGHIIDPKERMRYGYGFIAGKQFEIITCSHLAFFDTMLFERLWNKELDTIFLKYKNDTLDLAIYGQLHKIFNDTLSLGSIGDYNSTRIGDTLTYLIFMDLKDIYMLYRPVTNFISLGEPNHPIEGFLIDSLGKPGTSGSPVVNSRGRVIGIISHGRQWPDKDGRLVETACAMSLKPIVKYLNNGY